MFTSIDYMDPWAQQGCHQPSQSVKLFLQFSRSGRPRYIKTSVAGDALSTLNIVLHRIILRISKTNSPQSHRSPTFCLSVSVSPSRHDVAVYTCTRWRPRGRRLLPTLRVPSRQCTRCGFYMSHITLIHHAIQYQSVQTFRIQLFIRSLATFYICLYKQNWYWDQQWSIISCSYQLYL